MFRLIRSAGMLIVIAGLLLTACKSTPATPTPDPNAIVTAAAATVQAEMTRVAQLTPSPTNTPPATDTPQPTATPATPSDTPVPLATATSTGVPDRAQFIGETIPDHTKMAPGTTFTKSWTLKNVGTTTWTTAYSLVFYSGTRMGGPNDLNLTKTVKPGEQVDIVMQLTAPSTTGTYQGNYVLRNADGVNFFPVSVVIDVVEMTSTPTSAPTNSPAPTQTPTP
jgi:hypothetical protein